LLICLVTVFAGVQIVDPKLASYGVEGSPLYAVGQLAKTTIRSELREITMEDILNMKSRELNEKILVSLVR
jgi:regulator of protease activity HflC (stomatin/prohibitin superfamily)